MTEPAGKLVFEKKAWDHMLGASEEGYPKEVCGLLFGKGNKVSKVEILQNMLAASNRKKLEELVEAGAVPISRERALNGGNFEFLIDPREHYQKTAQAEKEGLDQIGLFHSHPDHPAAPSATDSAQPFLAGWSSVIVAVHGQKFKEARSWRRQTEDAPFKEESIFVQ